MCRHNVEYNDEFMNSDYQSSSKVDFTTLKEFQQHGRCEERVVDDRRHDVIFMLTLS